MILSTDLSPLCTALVGLQTLIEVPESMDMPFGFSTYRAEFLAAEEVNQIGFRYVIGAVTDKMGHTVFTAPLVYGGFAVAGERHDFIGSHHIGAADKQRCIVAVKPVQSFLGQLPWHPRALVSLGPIPAGSG